MIAMNEFFLIRHAETLWNQQKRIQGHQDSPLSESGEHMAAAWGKVLKGWAFNRILASDLGRTVKTAELINQTLELPVSKEKKLREMDWGKWSGSIYKEIRKSSPDEVKKQVHQCWKFQPPGGENRIDVLNRSLDALNCAAEKWPLEKILVVTHEGVIHTLINHFLNRTFMWNEPDVIKNYHIHQLYYDKNELEPDLKLKLKEANAFSLNMDDLQRNIH